MLFSCCCVMTSRPATAFARCPWIIWLLMGQAMLLHAEIPTKGKHTRPQDTQLGSVEDIDMPRFAEPIANVTVSIGRDALLACVVENLKGYKVAWVRVDTQTILSIHHNVISQNNRISLTYNDHRSWYLHIKEVEENDRGWYMCQVNTDPMRSRKGYLQVVVPPVIVEGMTSNDMVVREGLNVTLMCKARGYPEPYVMWRREDGEEMLIGGEHVNVVDGELLHITKVSRLHMAAYLCVASNGVPPSISKRVHLRVQFPPMLSIPNQLEGAYVGQDVVLECHTEAYPASINYWTTERGDMIISDTSRAGDKYETTSTVSGYTKYMKLRIRTVGPNDFGTYRCVAKNSLGETDGNIKLDEMPTPTTATIAEMALQNRSLGNGNGGDSNQTPVRNPPGAFHNSASTLAQRNLLPGIIHGIKMQSFGIFKRLSTYAVTLAAAIVPAAPRRPSADVLPAAATMDDVDRFKKTRPQLRAGTATAAAAAATAAALLVAMLLIFLQRRISRNRHKAAAVLQAATTGDRRSSIALATCASCTAATRSKGKAASKAVCSYANCSQMGGVLAAGSIHRAAQAERYAEHFAEIKSDFLRMHATLLLRCVFYAKFSAADTAKRRLTADDGALSPNSTQTTAQFYDFSQTHKIAKTKILCQTRSRRSSRAYNDKLI